MVGRMQFYLNVQCNQRIAFLEAGPGVNGRCDLLGPGPDVPDPVLGRSPRRPPPPPPAPRSPGRGASVFLVKVAGLVVGVDPLIGQSLADVAALVDRARRQGPALRTGTLRDSDHQIRHPLASGLLTGARRRLA
jgi:hypothetical protein